MGSTPRRVTVGVRLLDYPEVRAALARAAGEVKKAEATREAATEAAWRLVYEWSGGETWNPCPAGIPDAEYRDDLLRRLVL